MAIRDLRSQRLYVEAGIAQGNSIEASREQSNYLLNVLRLKAGSILLVFNGRDGEWKAEVSPTGRKSCDLVPIELNRPQTLPSNLVYCFAPLKQARLDYMIQKAVEMGVGILQPTITQHTQIRTVKHDRMLSNAIEAAEQCGLLNIPEIRNPIELSLLPNKVANSVLVVCDEMAGDAQGLESIECTANVSLAVLVGPEGGFSADERDLLKSLENSVFLGLGPRILRADTAAVAALAVLQSKIGDWYPKLSE